jgi:hypothetical protein
MRFLVDDYTDVVEREGQDVQAPQQGNRSRFEVRSRRGVGRCEVSQRTLLGSDPLPAQPRWLPEVDLVNTEKPSESRQGHHSVRG